MLAVPVTWKEGRLTQMHVARVTMTVCHSARPSQWAASLVFQGCSVWVLVELCLAHPSLPPLPEPPSQVMRQREASWPRRPVWKGVTEAELKKRVREAQRAAKAAKRRERGQGGEGEQGDSAGDDGGQEQGDGAGGEGGS